VTASLPGALIAKEGRALAPIWLGAVVAIIAGTSAGMLTGALLAFILGAAALGVFSIGHEYGNRTLTSLLAQPLTRSRLLLSKAVVLASLLVLLSIITALVLLRANGIERMLGGNSAASQWRLAIVVLTPLLGLCVAPWLTMLFRNATAGLVFTLAVPSVLWIAGQIARAASVDFDFVDLEVGNPFGYGPALTLMTVGVLAVSIVAALHGRKLFVGLEALDAPRDLLPSIRRRPFAGATHVASRHARRRGPLVLFVKKEVRLYGLAFALAALYAIGWIALWLARADTYLADNSFEFFAGMYGLFIALLVGATSIAEERALGTADTQFLQPWPFWKQWLTKAATVSAISLVVGLAVPRTLQAVLPLIQSSRPAGPDLGDLRFFLPNPLNGGVAMILLATLFSCYVSSLCVGGLRALLAALPLSFSLASLCTYLLYSVYALQRTLRIKYGLREFWWQGLPTATPQDFRTAFLYSQWMAAIAFLGFVAMLSFFLLRNFNSGERGTTTARTQIPWLVVYVVIAAVLIRGGDSLLTWWLLTH
jgi:ABC-2 family transporter